MSPRILVLIFALIAVSSCDSDKKEDRRLLIPGSWDAKWQTLPESFPGVTDVDFTMNGKITFSDDSVTILAFGYPGCIFSSDTLNHSLRWKLSNDSLHLINEENVYGMSYQVNSIQKDTIKLQLMEDIFLTLSK